MRFGNYCLNCGAEMHECHDVCRACGHEVGEPTTLNCCSLCRHAVEQNLEGHKCKVTGRLMRAEKHDCLYFLKE